MPHGHCYLWMPSLVWTHVTTDLLIGFAYASISFSLYSLIKKIRLPFSAMVLSFGVFIGACGVTHFMEVWNLWHADYWWSALAKALTAIASVATALWLVKLKPQMILVSQAAKLSEERRSQLESTNFELEEKTRELTRINERLEEQQKLLAHSAKMSALGEMAGGIAHEINSPLAIITVRANQLERLLGRNALTPELLHQETQLIATTAKRIGEIIKGLRVFARVGDKDPFETSSVAAIIEDALVLCQNRFETHGIELRVSEIPPDLEISCRAVQIVQVIFNLLNNAYDAVESLGEKWIQVAVLDLVDQVEISVTDSGSGIPEEVQPRIMLPFFTTKEVGKGTGLGLSISKGIIESHFGALSLDTSSKNTCFVVRLPKKHEPNSISV